MITEMNSTQEHNNVWQAPVKRILTELKDKPGALLPVLHAIQTEIGYVPAESVTLIAESLSLSRAEVHGVISFYTFFRSTRGGSHTLQICRSESCQAMGSRELESHAKQSLQIGFDQTTLAGDITLEAVYCLGNCACSPAVRIDHQVYGRVTAEKFDQLVSALRTNVIEVM